jgi:hypothetical protein
MDAVDSQAGTCAGGVGATAAGFSQTPTPQPGQPVTKFDGLVKSSFTDDFVISSKFKAREFRVMRRIYHTPQ